MEKRACCFKFFTEYRGYRVRNGGKSTEIVKRPNVLYMTHLEVPWAKFNLLYAEFLALVRVSYRVGP